MVRALQEDAVATRTRRLAARVTTTMPAGTA